MEEPFAHWLWLWTRGLLVWEVNRRLDGTVQPSSGHFPLNINTVTDRDHPQGQLEYFHGPLQSRVYNTVKSYYLKYFTVFLKSLFFLACDLGSVGSPLWTEAQREEGQT